MQDSPKSGNSLNIEAHNDPKSGNSLDLVAHNAAKYIPFQECFPQLIVFKKSTHSVDSRWTTQLP